MRNVVAVLVDGGDAKFGHAFADGEAVGQAKHGVSGAVGEFDASVGRVKNDSNVKIANERAEALFAGAEDVFGLLALGDIADDDERTRLAVEFDNGSAHLADADLAGFGAETKFEVADVAGFAEARKNQVAPVEIHPKIHLRGGFAEGFLAGEAGETGVALVEFEIRAVGERVDAEGVRAIAESGGKNFFGAAESSFGVEKIFGNAALTAIGEDETDGRADDGGGDDEPGEHDLFAGNGATHEDYKEGDGDGQDLGIEKSANARVGGGQGKRRGLLPVDGEDDDEEAGKHPDEVTPSGGDAGVDQSKEIFGVGENESEEYRGQDEAKGAQPRRKRGAGPEEEGEREERVARKVNEENLAEKSGLVGLPTRGGVEEIEIESDSEDSDLQKIEKTKGIDGGRIFFGTRKEDHEDGSSPDEEEDVGGPRALRGAGDETLVIGADGLAQGFQGKGDSEKEPKLARITGRAAGGVEAANGGEENYGGVEGVGSEETAGGGANEFEIKEKQQHEEKSGRESETRKSTRGEQGKPHSEVEKVSVQQKGGRLRRLRKGRRQRIKRRQGKG